MKTKTFSRTIPSINLIYPDLLEAEGLEPGGRGGGAVIVDGVSLEGAIIRFLTKKSSLSLPNELSYEVQLAFSHAGRHNHVLFYELTIFPKEVRFI